MRDPRTLGPYAPQPPGLLDLIRGGAGAAPAMAAAAAPPPSVGQRFAGLVGGGVSSLASLPFLIPQAAAARLQQRIGEARNSLEMGPLEIEQQRLANEQARRQGELAQIQLPAQTAAARAALRQQSALDERIAGAPDPKLRESLIRGAAGGPFRPFEVEPSAIDIATHQFVLGMTRDQADAEVRRKNAVEQERVEQGNRVALAGLQNRYSLGEIEARGAEERRTLRERPQFVEPKKEQLDAANYGRRIEQALADMEAVRTGGFNREEYAPSIIGALRPPTGAKGEGLKLQDQAEANFLTAVLRKESGAVISDQEFQRAEQQYFPRAGDTKKVLEQKERNRRQALEGLRAAAGPIWERVPLVTAPADSADWRSSPEAMAIREQVRTGKLSREEGRKRIEGLRGSR